MFFDLYDSLLAMYDNEPELIRALFFIGWIVLPIAFFAHLAVSFFRKEMARIEVKRFLMIAPNSSPALIAVAARLSLRRVEDVLEDLEMEGEIEKRL